MNNPDAEVLYIKKGKRYHVWGNALTHDAEVLYIKKGKRYHVWGNALTYGERFRQEMADAGGLLPDYWHSGSPAEIAQAGIDAVARAMANVAACNDAVATGTEDG